MYIRESLMKARQDGLLRAGAQARLAAEARQCRLAQRHRRQNGRLVHRLVAFRPRRLPA
jgi:hypothetical protein